jgi:glycosyltransferase involved in cell wall biosynthesis
MPPPPQHELVSVVMPVHNALPYLDAAVRSILAQSYRNFEFVIYDDASTDGSAERLSYWAEQDERIRLHGGERNLGPARSSNAAVERATANIIARMDADDLSHPDRIARQLEVLASQPDVGLVGTLCEIIDADGRKLRGPEYWRLSRNSPFVPFPHGSIMFRREAFDRSGGYRSKCEYWEDQDLVIRIARQTKVLVLPEALYQHRQSRLSTRIASNQHRVEHAVDLMYRSMDRLRTDGDYEEFLKSAKAGDGPVDPRVFVSLGSLVLWAGGKPRLFRRLLKSGRLRPDLRTVSSMVWTGWATASPATLRLFLSMLVRGRSIAARSARDPAPVRWSPPSRHPEPEPSADAAQARSLRSP